MLRTCLSKLALCLLLVACRQDMHDQLKLEPLEGSDFFEDGRGSRDPVEGTIPRGHLRADRHMFEGKRSDLDPETGESKDQLVAEFPFTVDEEVLLHGQERYNIYCSPCHARTGRGDGMIVQRGFQPPPPLWDEELREAPVGHLYDVITRGLGAMPAYARQIPVRDRWAIVAYVRALQFAHHAKLDEELTAKHREAALDALAKSPADTTEGKP